MLGCLPWHQPFSGALLLIQHGRGRDAFMHAGRGSLSRGPWNKCGYLVYYSLFKVHFPLIVLCLVFHTLLYTIMHYKEVFDTKLKNPFGINW